jgi:DNA polymerase III alpha subunit (gram-positive type)
MTTRNLIIVDTETNGLDPNRHHAVEVGWWDLSTGKRGEFIPTHDVSETLANADIKALQLNRYIDRIADQAQDRDGKKAWELAELLQSNTLVAANPGFDAWVLTKMYSMYEAATVTFLPQWHYRLWDIEAYAAAVLGLNYVPGLVEICRMLDIGFAPDHTAHGDVTATGLCFIALAERAGAKLGVALQ